MSAVSHPDQTRTEPSRLNGWKDIATHLGKGVRTVQRWEKQYGLPVHRIGEGVKIVYALPDEIDEWLGRVRQGHSGDGGTGNGETAPTLPGAAADAPLLNGGRPAIGPAPAVAGDAGAMAPARPGRRRVVMAVASVALVVITGIGWLTLALGRPGASDGTADGASAPRGAALPASFRVEKDHLAVLDAEGRLAWTHPLDPVATQNWFQPRPGWSEPVAIVDLDGDGPREVLISTPYRWPRGYHLVCLNADGTTRWTREPDDRHRFGDQWYSAPWSSAYFKVSRRPDGSAVVLAAFHHHLLFPSVLEQIAPDGRVVSRYWSNGYVASISEATWQGREVLLVGAASNEFKGNALAILDRANPSGSAPAENPNYRCATCPGPAPLSFVVFPPPPLGRVQGETGMVRQTWVNADGELLVSTDYHVDGFDVPGSIFFALDQRLRPRRIEVAASYRNLHDMVFKAGRIDRPYTPAEERLMVPLLRWDGRRFVEAPLAR